MADTYSTDGVSVAMICVNALGMGEHPRYCDRYDALEWEGLVRVVHAARNMLWPDASESRKCLASQRCVTAGLESLLQQVTLSSVLIT